MYAYTYTYTCTTAFSYMHYSNTGDVEYINAISVFVLIAPFILYDTRAAEIGHALHVLKTLMHTYINI